MVDKEQEKDFSIGSPNRWWAAYVHPVLTEVTHEMVSEAIHYYLNQKARRLHYRYFHWGKRMDGEQKRDHLFNQLIRLELLIDLIFEFKNEGLILREYQRTTLDDLLKDANYDFYKPGRTFNI